MLRPGSPHSHFYVEARVNKPAARIICINIIVDGRICIGGGRSLVEDVVHTDGEACRIVGDFEAHFEIRVDYSFGLAVLHRIYGI